MPMQQTTSILSTSRNVSAVERIEGTLSELQKIFTQMAGLVSEQQETLDRIDSDLFMSLDNVNEGQNWLLKYQRAISSHRGLIIRAFIVLAFFVTIFLIFYK